MTSSRAVTLVCLVLAAVLQAQGRTRLPDSKAGGSTASQVEDAISCGQVTSALSPCIPYLRGTVQQQPPACCSGIKNLNAAAKTTPDRQAVCGCIKSAAAGIPGINYGLANGLPGKCGVSVPYKIAPSTDCSKVK